jgi:antitoxin HigA-1
MAKLLPPVTPGEILREEFMVPLGLSANRLAEALGVPANRITAIVNGTRAVTADTALRSGSIFRCCTIWRWPAAPPTRPLPRP